MSVPMADPTKMFWNGRPLAECSKQELADLIVVLRHQFDRMSDNFFKLVELNQRLLEQNQKLLGVSKQ